MFRSVERFTLVGPLSAQSVLFIYLLFTISNHPSPSVHVVFICFLKDHFDPHLTRFRGLVARVDPGLSLKLNCQSDAKQLFDSQEQIGRPDVMWSVQKPRDNCQHQTQK